MHDGRIVELNKTERNPQEWNGAGKERSPKKNCKALPPDAGRRKANYDRADQSTGGAKPKFQEASMPKRRGLETRNHRHFAVCIAQHFHACGPRASPRCRAM